MPKVIGMIPARLGSQRVPKKNLRLLGGKPLVSYIIESAKESGVLDEIYINSEADIFSEIATDGGVCFYKRPAHLATDQANNDDFALDFIQNVPADILVQLLPTSPLITPVEIRQFVEAMISGGFDTMVSVVNHQLASLFQGKPINFSTLESHKSSQMMVPAQSYATVLMAWSYQNFEKNIRELGCAYHGGRGKIGYYPLGGLTTIDIDHEEDFLFAEAAMQFRQSQKFEEKKYYESRRNNREVAEIDVPQILRKDGVFHSDFTQENLPLVNLDKNIAAKDNTKSWCQRIINTENNSATLISQIPGEGNRLHYHPDWNEWWYIVAGEWEWKIEGKSFRVRQGDIVFIDKGKWHKITAVGDHPAVRLAVSRDKVPHVYRELGEG